MALFYVESAWGCGIRNGRTLSSAERSFREEVGSYGFKSIRPAEMADIEWVRAMGGDVPERALSTNEGGR
jgi:hypothetical protein